MSPPPTSLMPGPAVQAINAALHREPIATIAYACIWCSTLLVGTPIAIVVLILRAVFRLLALYGWTKNNSTTAYDPKANPPTVDCEMAVVITGCDSGFGQELALAAADAGYTVFAGCLNASQSFTGALPHRIIPMAMDVTSDVQVNATVEIVQAWIDHKESGTSDPVDAASKQKRVLHAVINNAGVGTFGLVDGSDISDYQHCMEGK